MTSSRRAVLIALILLGALLRFPGLFQNTFHADEALFATWARLIGVWRDPLLMTAAVDKPPLLFYLQAIFYPLMGTPDEWPARLVNLAASMLMIPLTARLAYALFRDALTTLAAAAVLTLSPLAVQFSATAFTDPLLTMWLLAAFVLVAPAGARPESDSQNAFWAGLVFGLAAATKYQAWLFLPLVVGLGWLRGWRKVAWLRWTAGLLMVLVALGLWENARAGELTLLGNQMRSYGGLGPALPDELLSRLGDWFQLLVTLFGSPALTALFVILMPAMLIVLATLRRDDHSLPEQLLALFMLGYLAVHWLLDVPAWDRYLLPIVPLAAIAFARVLGRVGGLFPQHARLVPAAVILSCALMAPAAWQARAGEWPIGGRPQADSGAAEVAALLQDAPYGTVLYDHWFSWHWRYYFFDRGVFVSWFPDAETLIRDLTAFADGADARYLVLPRSEEAGPIMRRVTDAGFELQLFHEAQGMSLYRLYRAEPR
jgi:4-amino-4-deoxy-L-arabinose transferase-like glycosyltransferase